MKRLKPPYTKKSYEKMATLFKIMANEKRLEILNLLGTKEMNVTELIKKMGIRKSNAIALYFLAKAQ